MLFSQFMQHSKAATFKKFVQFFGWVNILSSIGMVLPQLADISLTQMSQFNTLLNLGGQIYTTPTNPFHSFLINIAGMSLVLIGILALLAAKNITSRKDLLIWNGIAKTVFASITLYYIFALDIMRIFVGFALMDIGIVLGYVYFLRKKI